MNLLQLQQRSPPEVKSHTVLTHKQKKLYFSPFKLFLPAVSLPTSSQSCFIPTNKVNDALRGEAPPTSFYGLEEAKSRAAAVEEREEEKEEKEDGRRRSTTKGINV